MQGSSSAKHPTLGAQEMRGYEFPLAAFKEAEQLGAEQICFLAVDGGGVVALLRGKTPIVEHQLTQEMYQVVRSSLQQLSFTWPNIDDPIWTTSQKQGRRVFISGLEGTRLWGSVVLKRDVSGGNDALVLELARREDVPDFWKLFSFSPQNKVLLEQGLKRQNGVVLCCTSTQRLQPEAAATVLALRPDALYCGVVQTSEHAESILAKAQHRLVTVELNGNDPVELITQFAGLIANKPQLRAQFCASLVLSVVSRRTKRVCSACARSSSIDPNTLAKVPEVVRPDKDRGYMLGRGCAQCGQSAYRGSVDLESIVAVGDRFRQVLLDDLSPQSLTEIAYREGTRSLLEDGIYKVCAGVTSIEGVLGVVDQLSQAFRASIAANQVVPKEAPKDAQVREALESLDLEYFKAGRAAARLLIIEDDADQREILRLVFTKEGYEVTDARNGDEALKMLGRTQVDLVVCDLMMPIMSGEKFVQELRKVPAYRDIPVLILTAVNTPESEVNLLSVGADDFCAKTVHRKVLLKRVERLLEKTGQSKGKLTHLLKE